MSTPLESAMRSALDRLTDEPPPPGLAHGAIRRAGRQRAARFGLAGAAAVVALAAASVVVPLLGRAPAADSPAAGGKPFAVTAYGGITAGPDPGPADDYSLLLNRATGRYDKVPYNGVTPAPDGELVLVHEGDNSVAFPSRWGLLHPARDVTWLSGLPDPGYLSGPEWSRDGRKILFTHRPKSATGGGFVVVDVATLAVTPVAVPDVDARNAQGATFLWTPDGAGVALTLSDVSESAPDQPPVVGIGFYDLAGVQQRVLPERGGQLRSFSPDGKKLVVRPTKPDGGVTVVEFEPGTDKIVRAVGLPVDQVLGWYDDDHLIVVFRGDTDQKDRPWIAVAGWAGRPTRVVLPAVDPNAVQRIHVGSSAGLPASARDLTF